MKKIILLYFLFILIIAPSLNKTIAGPAGADECQIPSDCLTPNSQCIEDASGTRKCVPINTNYPGPFDIGSRFGFGGFKSLGEATDKLVNPVFSIAASLVTLYFVFGAFDYARSGGDKEAVAKARKKITHAIIGFILLMFAFLILQFIPQFFNFAGAGIIK